MYIKAIHLPNRLVNSSGILLPAEQPIIPKPPAWASIKDAPTGVPGFNPSSKAASSLNPLPTGDPGILTSLPVKSYKM